ncbi:GNAT family N-acetyltransferase [Thalassotalea atypica]|uniref:GNAT family N-acetyltransferase n=1 Tax=Thalassotalea atypica TaxID=2054316 RepID=UPI002572AD23|nr:GNAT family N-acetyltransferase [Thalassotalea atypica]
MRTDKNITYQAMSPADLEQIIRLGNHVHGDGYLTQENAKAWFEKGLSGNINAGFVAYDDKKLVGFRLTYATNNWHIDQWCSPELWQASQERVCYFKCNTVDEQYRGYGIGSELLRLSIEAAQQQGAVAGVSHLWKQSPGNSAVKYFTKCGGQLVKLHPDKWREDALNGYDCILCGNDCHCEAAEMIIYFDDK